MNRKLTVAVVGCGDFARNFVPLFQAHPYVKKVYVCDMIRRRAEEYSRLFGVPVIDSYEEILKNNEISAVAIFVQWHLHGPLSEAALRADKHVYSAVPMASEVEECGRIVELVKETGLIYMMGETCYYYPCALYCRKTYGEGTFGRFVYGEAQYHHDIQHFPAGFLADRQTAGVPPFYYPTHSTAMILSAVCSYVTKVSAFGYVDQEMDGIYGKGVNQWDNLFSDSFSLMQLAGGGTARINECRRIGYKAPSSYISAFYGTEGAYQFQNAQHLFTVKKQTGVELKDVSDEVNPREMSIHKIDIDFHNQVANHKWQWDHFSPQQEEEQKRLPESYKGLINGHMASHQFLIDDFCTAVYHGKQPPVNAWVAARYTIPGLIAHKSVLKGGELMLVPDFGDMGYAQQISGMNYQTRSSCGKRHKIS